MNLDTLNPGQRAAVQAPDGAHLVIAGAGTGKTRTLVHRVAWLIEQGVEPQRIALLTFTRRAAKEMLERATALVGAPAQRVQGGTFHSFAASILRRHAEALGYPPGFSVLDTDDAASLVGVIRDQMGIASKERKFPRKDTLYKIFSSVANTRKSLAATVEEQYPAYAHEIETIEQIAQAFAKRKRQQGVMDFDDLLNRLAELLRDHPAVRQQVSSRLEYVLVDEYQDTNLVQAEIARQLASVHGNLMVVGDEAQSIYGFRGAAVENILDFPNFHQGCAITLLEENYRSLQPVLDLANGVLRSATRGYGKQLRSAIPAESPPRPQLVQVFDEVDQARFVARTALEWRLGGRPLRDLAVLVRSAYQANLVEVELTQANLPFRKFGGISFTQLAHVKDVLAMLRLIANPRDELAWLRVLGWFDGLGPASAAKIAEHIAGATPPRLDATPWKSRKYGPSLTHLAEFLADTPVLIPHPEQLVERLLAWYRPHFEAIYEDAPQRRKDFDALWQLAERTETLDTLIAELALDPVACTETDDGEPDWVTVSTIHSAKGLEWGTVFVLQLYDGHFPTGYALESAEGIEEERRLFYVAVTRAKERLFLLQPEMASARYGAPIEPGCLLLDSVRGLRQLIHRVSAEFNEDEVPF